MIEHELFQGKRSWNLCHYHTDIRTSVGKEILMNKAKMFKALGWDEDIQSQLNMVVTNTRDTMKHLIFGMRVTTSPFEEHFIRAYDRNGNKVIADSEVLDSRDTTIELYDALVRHYDLPYCCLVHEKELTQLEGFDDDEENELSGFGFDDEEEALDGFGFDEDEDPGDFGFDFDEDEEDFEFDLD